MTFFRNIFENFKRYSFLAEQLLARHFKVKYKRSALGILWSLLYPILMMLVMAAIFSKMLRFTVEGVNYFVYLEIGLVMFSFFSDSTTQAMSSVVVNFPLMTKVYIPKYIFPLAKCMFVGVNFLLTLIPLAGVVIISFFGSMPCHLSWWYFFLPIIFVCEFLFCIGLGFLLATISVFFRDMFYIYGIVTTIWTYATPIFYDISMIPDRLLPIFKMNPLYLFINSVRRIILYGNAPDGLEVLWMFVWAIGMLLIGCIAFKRHQDEFVYYV